MHGHLSPTRTTLVRDLMKACTLRHDLTRPDVPPRLGQSASFMRRIVAVGTGVLPMVDIGYCAAVVFAFIFHCGTHKLRPVRSSNVVFPTDGVLDIVLRHRKGQRVARPLQLSYEAQAGWTTETPISLFREWEALRPPSQRFFNLMPIATNNTSLSTSVDRVVRFTGQPVPLRCYFASQIPSTRSFQRAHVSVLDRNPIICRID